MSLSEFLYIFLTTYIAKIFTCFYDRKLDRRKEIIETVKESCLREYLKYGKNQQKYSFLTQFPYILYVPYVRCLMAFFEISKRLHTLTYSVLPGIHI